MFELAVVDVVVVGAVDRYGDVNGFMCSILGDVFP